MTEAGEKWSEKVQYDKGNWENVCSSRMLDFWLRAFCEEVEKLAGDPGSESYPELIAEAFWQVKRELLG